MVTRTRLGREARRVLRQIRGFPALVIDAALARRRYDRDRDALLRRHGGEVPAGPKAAIYLVYPRHGVVESHLLALRHLVARGYAPLVVSNLPLAPDDLARLRPLARAVIERPNVGYDFGGYRDGVLSLADELPRLELLLLLNDSAWFPLRQESDWLPKAEALKVDLVGPSTHYGMPRVPVERWRTFRFAHGTDSRDFHYTSFALLWSARALRDPGFLGFWRGYRLTGVKARTVRRGEIGLSRWAIRRGLSHAALPAPEHVAERLVSLDPPVMRAAVARSYLIDDAAMRAERAALLAADDGSAAWRDDAATFLLACAARRGAAYVLWRELIAAGSPFLKKTPFSNRSGDRAELPADAPVDDDMMAAIRAEIALDRTDRRSDQPSGETGERMPSSTPRR